MRDMKRHGRRACGEEAWEGERPREPAGGSMDGMDSMDGKDVVEQEFDPTLSVWSMRRVF